MPFRLTFVLAPSRRKAARITLALGGGVFLGGQERALSREYLNIMLRCLVEINVAYLRAYPNTPRLADAGMLYREEPPGQEDWQDIPTCIKMGIADCLPTSTLVLRNDYSFAPIGELMVGDQIMENGRSVDVRAVLRTGLKSILSFSLSNGRVLRCTPEHRLITGDDREVRACDVVVNDDLLAPTPTSPVRVRGISLEPQKAECVDIETSTGRFYLPESDTIVHNCEDLASWRAAELTVSGLPTAAVWKEFTNPDGSTLFHIVVERSDGITEDPSAWYGMR